MYNAILRIKVDLGSNYEKQKNHVREKNFCPLDSFLFQQGFWKNTSRNTWLQLVYDIAFTCQIEPI
jgi:hypothetical protein